MDAVLSVFQTRAAETEAFVYGAAEGLKKAQKKAQVWGEVCHSLRRLVCFRLRGYCQGLDGQVIILGGDGA